MQLAGHGVEILAEALAFLTQQHAHPLAWRGGHFGGTVGAFLWRRLGPVLRFHLDQLLVLPQARQIAPMRHLPERPPPPIRRPQAGPSSMRFLPNRDRQGQMLDVAGAVFAYSATPWSRA